MSDLAEEVIALVSKCSGIAAGEITLQSRLLHDLGVDGDDGCELLHDFGKKFEVDMRGFEFDRHFNSEATVALAWVWPPYLRRLEGQKLPITVADLIAAAERKKWNR